MERLTNKAWRNFDPWECCGQDKYCQRGCHDPGGCTKGCIVPQLSARLGAYEDTGLTPEEVLPKDKADEIALKLMRLADLESICSYTRLRELAEADKDGRLVVPPCKDWLEVVFGDQVLFWGIDKDYVEQPIREISLDDADRIGWYDGYKTVFLKGTDENGEAWEFYPEEIGKTVFLTREAAEKALEAMKDGNG
jgi:hypothetical protein